MLFRTGVGTATAARGRDVRLLEIEGGFGEYENGAGGENFGKIREGLSSAELHFEEAGREIFQANAADECLGLKCKPDRKMEVLLGFSIPPSFQGFGFNLHF